MVGLSEQVSDSSSPFQISDDAYPNLTIPFCPNKQPMPENASNSTKKSYAAALATTPTLIPTSDQAIVIENADIRSVRISETDFRYELPDPREAEWLEFEKRLGLSDSSSPVKLSDSSSSGNRGFDKIYVLTLCTDAQYNSGYCLYCIDINSSCESNGGKEIHIQSLKPILCWDSDYYSTFAILGSKLYMFCGMHDNRRWKNRVSIFDLGGVLSSSTPTSTPTLLNKESRQVGPKMSGSKFNPVALVMDDSRICVFGSVLYDRYSSEPIRHPSFELFDTKDLTWKWLPQPPIKYDNRLETVFVQSYAVHPHCSCLIIQISSNVGIYGINVNNPKPKWVFLDQSCRIRSFPLKGMWTMVDNKLCSPFFVMRRGHPLSMKIAFKAPIIRESLLRGFPTGVLCFDAKCIDLCIVRGGLQWFNNVANLLVDIVKFDDESCESLASSDDLSKWQQIQSHKSFTFALTSCPCEELIVIACFPIKRTESKHIDPQKVALKSEALSSKPFVSSHKVGTKGNGRFERRRRP